MGDRALVIFTDGEDVSPTVYLHWNATAVPTWLAEHKDLMTSRGSDVQYAAARFIGIAHSGISGNLSLGCWNTDKKIGDAVLVVADKNATANSRAEAEAILSRHSYRDGGVVVVNVNDYTWQAFGGYLADRTQAA